MDVVLGVVVFLIAVFVFYNLITYSRPPPEKKLKEDASFISKLVTADNSMIEMVFDNEFNESKFISLKNVSYRILKSNMKIDSDFCIYLEDEKGNIIEVNFTYKGLGAGSINVTGTPCNST